MGLRLVLGMLVLTAAFSARQAEAEASKAPPTVVACADLISLRRLMSENEEGVRPTLAEVPACHEIAADKVGPVERRTMIGVEPFECRQVKDSACLWVRP